VALWYNREYNAVAPAALAFAAGDVRSARIDSRAERTFYVLADLAPAEARRLECPHPSSEKGAAGWSRRRKFFSAAGPSRPFARRRRADDRRVLSG
jgi:hypothetical protein